jgi:single-stranded-DNA-specific exonuclease
MAHLTEEDIGFTIGPRINAASRMDTPENAFLMLSSTDEGEAGGYVDHLEHLNNERRGIVASMTKEINKRLKMEVDMQPVIVMGNPDWRPSLVGLVANKLTEEYKRPAFLWGRDGNGIIKGSCRSDGYTSVVNLMNEASHLFIEHGGHHFSGGFGVFDEHIHTLPSALNEVFLKMGEKARFESSIVLDAELTLEAIDRIFLREQSLLAPFGEGNPKPLYRFKGVTPERVEVFGKAKEHLKLIFDTRGMAKEAICFFTSPEDFGEKLSSGQAIDLYAHVEQSYFMGRLQTRMRIVDIL